MSKPADFTRTIGPVTTGANVEFHSPGVQIATTISDLSIQVTDPSSQWFTRSGFVKVWGLQISPDNADWTWGPIYEGDESKLNPSIWIPFGRPSRHNSLPGLIIGIGGSGLVAAANQWLRLAIETDTAITLGAVISVAV